jgi:hypothetical protein
MTRNFARFACIDWSGQAVERPAGIALAISDADNRAPMLERPDRGWSRQAILDWLLDHAKAQSDMLIGIDFSASLPFIDRGAYFPDWPESPTDARSLWRCIDELCAGDPHLAVTSLTTHAETRRHFRHSQGQQTIVGDLFGAPMGRFRHVEEVCRLGEHANPVSCFNLIGAAQVGKSSLTGMRVLHQLAGRVPVWPFDPVPVTGPMIVEIYTTIAAREAGLPKGRSKMRDAESLAAALRQFDLPMSVLDRYDDHSTDAILTAAWLRRAAADPRLWHPKAMTPNLIATEGWTFGVP